MFINKDSCNVTNYFMETKEIENDLTKVIVNHHEGIFGIEIEVSSGVMGINRLITPSFLRLNRDGIVDYRIAYLDGCNFYEGFLTKPFFLPLYSNLNGEALNDIQNIPLEKGEKIYCQWLFMKAKGWKEKALNMYESYLYGNDYPTSSQLGRKVQDKLLYVLDNLSSFSHTRNYSDEVEEKILNTGYRFQLRLAIRSHDPNIVKDMVEDQLKKYDGYNTLRFFKQNSKHTASQFANCIMTSDTLHQILTTKEMQSLFGVNIHKGQVKNETNNNPQTKDHLNDVIQILPRYQHIASNASDTTIISKLADALKRVGIINQSRIYNEEFMEGVRLTVVQCDIPKGKTLTNIISKQKDIQAALGALSLNIEQGDMPDTVRFTFPKDTPSVISLRELIELGSFQEYRQKHPLSFIVGVDEVNNPLYLSLTNLIHLMVVGTTGSGKSVFVNSVAITLIMTHTPDQLRLIMIDPKQVEFSQYKEFPHVDEVVTDMNKAHKKLVELVEEMEYRYSLFSEHKVKNLERYNEKVSDTNKLPYIICIIDEYADLSNTNKEVEQHIQRLGQKARAAGIHLILATQRPSVKVINGTIKAVIPNAISFKLPSNTDYTTVFGKGLNNLNLLGKGDGVMKIEGYPKEFQRFQSAIISPNESQEEEVYEELIKYFYSVNNKSTSHQDSNSSEDSIEDDTLSKLKQIIKETRETRIEPLRKALGIKSSKMKELMTTLVDEGWLIKHSEKAKGYELTEKVKQ